MWHHITKPKVIAVGIPLLLGQIVGIVQGEDTLVWFKTLKKPSWCPPIPVFPAVWTVLYALIGYASYLVWQHGGLEAQSGALILYAVQLVLNLLWPIIFFKQKKLRTAMVENLALLATASATAYKFWQIDPLAGKLFVPYLAWILVANALNYSIMQQNPSGDEDPKLQDLYHGEDKRNPGEQGYRNRGPATAALQAPPPTHSHRNRGRLLVCAQARPRPTAATARAVVHARVPVCAGRSALSMRLAM